MFVLEDRDAVRTVKVIRRKILITFVRVGEKIDETDRGIYCPAQICFVCFLFSLLLVIIPNHCVFDWFLYNSSENKSFSQHYKRPVRIK